MRTTAARLRLPGRLALASILVLFVLVAGGSAAGQTATVVIGTHVQTIETSLYGPPSPDPAGIAYDAARDRFIISDSEVNEMTIYQGKNLFTGTRTGSGTGTGTTLPFSKEPAGLGLNPTDRTLFVSDDDKDVVYVDRPGPDGLHGTADDSVASFGTAAFGSTDPEDLEYDPHSGHLFISDGLGTEVYEVDPVNGVFGDGNDSVSHFDIARYGARDAEGLGLDPQRGVLLVVDPSTKSIYEVTKGGVLVRTIDCRGIPTTNKAYADVTMAPTSDPNDNPSRLNYWMVDRQTDNGTDPSENDGKLYEISAPATDAPPAVTVTAPPDGATVFGTVAVEANASDDRGVTRVAFSVDGASIGTDTNGADGWSVSWDTTAVADGAHTVEARATDTEGQTASDTNGVTVDNVDGPPTVTVTNPPEAATVSDTVVVRATASDDVAVTKVAFSVDGAGIGTDTNGADGWSASWNTLVELDGAHRVTATATDTRGQTESDSNDVTVDNTSPAVGVTRPLPGATVSGTVPLEATASDNQAVASVQFFVDAVEIGTDTNGEDGWSLPWDSTTAANGTRSVTALARDRAGNEATSVAVVVLVDNPELVVLEKAIAVGVDDADETQDGLVRRTGGDLELGTDNAIPTTVGLRFTGVTVPRGASVVNAHVQFQADEKGTAATNLTVRAENSDNAAPFTTAAFNISARPRTTPSVGWQPAPWTTVGSAGPDQRTPDLSAVLQQVVDRSGWSSGNALVVLVTGTGRRTAESFEGGAPPRVHIEYRVRRAAAEPPVNTSRPTIAGTPRLGETLTAHAGTWSGATPIAYAYQWMRCDVVGALCSGVGGATGSTYVLTSADVGKTMRVRVTATNGDGSSEATSDSTAVVEALPVDGLTQVADSTSGSSAPTYFASNHRVAVSAGGRVLVVHGRHASGVQLAWRDPGETWRTSTGGSVSDGLLLGGSGTGDWSASIAVARDRAGGEHAWVVWGAPSASGTGTPVQMRRLSSLDDPAGPTVGPIVTLADGATSPLKPDLAFERAPDGTSRGAVVWIRLLSGSQYELVVAWLDDLGTDAPSLRDTTTLIARQNANRNPTLAPTTGGLAIVARSGSSRLQIFRHDAAAPLGQWSTATQGIVTASASMPSAVTLASGDVLAAVESDTTAKVVTVQRFGSQGSASVDLELSGYSMPTIAAHGDGATLVMIRRSDGYVVSRSFSPQEGWSTEDRLEIGPEGGGNHSWPNLLREADGRLRLIVGGPSGGTKRAAVLSFQRTL